MKRLLLRIEHARGRSVQTRTLALPTIWTLRDLHGAILKCFPSWKTGHVFEFSSPDGTKRCEGTPVENTMGVGMRASDRIWKHFAKEGDRLECLYGDFAQERPVSVLFAGTDEGDGPACLAADGPKTGPNKPDPSRITAALRSEDEDGKDGEVLFSADRGDRLEDLPPDIRKAVENLLSKHPVGRPGLDEDSRLEWIPPSAEPALATPPEDIALDDTPADPALLRTAYALARRVWDLAPWRTLEEIAPVAIRLPDGRERILSVMGRLGEHFALAFYPDFPTFDAFQIVSSCEMPFGGEHFFSFWQWRLSFLRTAELLPGEAQTVKESGIAFARGRLPSLESFAPGFLPHPAGGRELEDLVHLLDASVALFADHAAMRRVRTLNSGFDPVNVWARDASGAWRLSAEKRDPALRFPLDLPPATLARLRLLPVRDRVMSFGEMLVPIGRPGERRRMERVVIAVDEETRFSIPPAFGQEDEEPRLFRPADLLRLIAETVMRSPLGCFPKRLATPSPFLALFLRRLAELRGGGAAYDPDARCDGIREYHRFLSSMLHV